MLTHSGDKPFKVNVGTCVNVLAFMEVCHVWIFLLSCCAAVCGRGLQRQLCVTGRAGPSRPQPLQPAELLQNVQPGQVEGGVSFQGRAQQEEEAQEQTKVLPTYVPLATHKPSTCSSTEMISHRFMEGFCW